jgi:hypothetical protein
MHYSFKECESLERKYHKVIHFENSVSPRKVGVLVSVKSPHKNAA